MKASVSPTSQMFRLYREVIPIYSPSCSSFCNCVVTTENPLYKQYVQSVNWLRKFWLIFRSCVPHLPRAMLSSLIWWSFKMGREHYMACGFVKIFAYAWTGTSGVFGNTMRPVQMKENFWICDQLKIVYGVTENGLKRRATHNYFRKQSKQTKNLTLMYFHSEYW